MRRIGFGEVARSPALIERTKAEVAGRSRMPAALRQRVHVLACC